MSGKVIPIDGNRRADSWFTGIKSRFDGWYSSLLGYGSTKDKREYTSFLNNLVTDSEAEQLWRSNWVASRIIEIFPRESLRQGFEVNVGKKEISEKLSARLEELNAIPVFMKAKQTERAYGGSAIWPVINDGQADMRLPLNLERISKIENLQIFEPRELSPSTYYTNPQDPLFGEPRTYTINPSSRGGVTRDLKGVQLGQEIHESRLILFRGIRVSRNQVSVNGWGDSVLNRPYETIRDHGISWAATATLLHEFSQASFKIKGLAELIASNKDDVIQARIRAVELSRSTINAVLMDAEEEYSRTQTPVAGLAELLNLFMTQLAASADMPVTVLMGISPAGLNATGESDIRLFYDRIACEQSLGIKPQLEQFVKLVMLTKGSPTGGKEPDTWSVVFNPLYRPTDKEIADTRKVIADTDAVNIQNQIYSPEEARTSRYGGDTYGMEIAIETEGDDDEIGPTGPDSEVANEVEAAAPEEVDNSSWAKPMLEIVMKAIGEEISRESASAILQTAFGLSPADAEKILGPKDFEPTKPEPPPNPFGGGPPPNGEADPDQTEGDDPEAEGKPPNPFAKKVPAEVTDDEDEKVRGDVVDPVPFDRLDGGPGSGPQGGKAKESSGSAPKTPDTAEKFGKGPQWERDWHPDRVKEVHEPFKQKVTEGVPKSDAPTVYMTGGGPAAGKSTGLLSNPAAGIPLKTDAAHIDPDGAKAAIPEYQEGIAAGDIGAAGAVHEESSHMAKEAVRSAVTDGHDVVYDSLGDSGIDRLEAKIAELRAAGAQRIVAAYATVDVEEAIARAAARGEETGRYIDEKIIREAHADVAQTSIAAIERGTFDEFKLFDTTTKEPTLVVSFDKAKGLEIHDEAAWERHKERAK